MALDKDQADELRLKVKELQQDLPCSYEGKYRGYINLEIGKKLKNLFERLLSLEKNFEKIKKQETEALYEKFKSINTDTGSIKGYMSVEIGESLKEFLGKLKEKEIDPIVRPQSNKQIDLIATVQSSLVNLSIFSESASTEKADQKQKLLDLYWAIEGKEEYKSISKLSPEERLKDITRESLNAHSVVDSLTPLSHSIKLKNRKFTKLLVEDKQVDVDAPNADLTTPLHVAIINDDSEMIDFLLQHNANINAYRSGKLGSPLEYITKYGKEDLLKLFISKCTERDIKLPDKDGILELTDNPSRLKLFGIDEEQKSLSY